MGTVTFTDEPIEYTDPPESWPNKNNVSYSENPPLKKGPTMFTFGILLGFFGMCSALDPDRLRKKRLKKSNN